ncbi:hypothetical protein HK100_002296, partial [Physocladia obscura]
METTLHLMAEISQRIAQMELQISQIKPIVETVTEIIIENIEDINSLIATSDKNIIQSTSSKYESNASFVSSKGTSPSVIDRDRVFCEAELKEKQKPLWKRLGRKGKTELTPLASVDTAAKIGAWDTQIHASNLLINPRIHQQLVVTKSSDRSLSSNLSEEVKESKSSTSLAGKENLVVSREKQLESSNFSVDSQKLEKKLSRRLSAKRSLKESTSSELSFSGQQKFADASVGSSHCSLHTSGSSRIPTIECRDFATVAICVETDEQTKIAPPLPADSALKFRIEKLKQNDCDHLTASPSADSVLTQILLPVNLNRAKTSRSRASSAMIHAIAEVTKAKYNSHGSIASVHNTNVQNNSEQLKSENESPAQLRNFFEKGLNPLSSFNASVDFFMACSATWIVPLTISFGISVHWGYSALLSTTFAIDTVVEMCTLRDNHHAMTVLKNRKLTNWQSHYLRNNFIVDFISIIPFEMLPVSGNTYLFAIRFLRVYKLPHIMNTCPKFIALRKSLESMLGIGQTFSGIFPLMFALCAFLHVESCALFLAGALTGFSNSAIAQAVGNTFPMTYKPITALEQIIVLIFIIVGAGLYASIVGTISSFAMGLNASGRLYKQKMDELHEYMRWKNINDTTKRKVMRKFFEEKTLLGEMNESLQMEIAAHNCKELIQKVHFLRREIGDGRDELFLGRIATALTACYFVAGDMIITQGE